MDNFINFFIAKCNKVEANNYIGSLIEYIRKSKFWQRLKNECDIEYFIRTHECREKFQDSVFSENIYDILLELIKKYNL